MAIARGEGFVLRALTAADMPLLARWRADPRVAEWYEEPVDPDGEVADGDATTYALAERDGEPVAYVQWYACDAEYLAAGGLTGEDGVYAFDIHLAPERVGTGLGTPLVRLVTEHLRAQGARRIVVDPEAANARAVRAYEKAGFVIVKKMPAYDVRAGLPRDHVLMERAQSARVDPPSTGTTQPVTYDAAGDSRNAATRPNSSGAP